MNKILQKSTVLSRSFLYEMRPNSRTQWNSWEPTIGVRIYRPTPIKVRGLLILTPSPSANLCRWWERRISTRRHFLRWCEDPLVLHIIFNQFHNAFWFTYLRKMTIVCSYPEMRHSICILNAIEEIYTHWIKSYEERYIQWIPSFTWDSQIPTLSLLYFSTIKRNTVVHWEE